MPALKQSVELSDEQIQRIARALADPRRYEILKQIGACDGTQTCAAMRESVDISPATLSHHMKELETAGLVRSEREGKFVRYLLQAGVLKAYLKRLRSDLI